MKEHNEKEYLSLCQKILSEVDKKQLNKIFSFPEMELEPDFLGFLEVYQELAKRIPKRFAIVDLGCNHAFQAWLFREHMLYVGVDNGIPAEYRLRTENANHFDMSIQDFLKTHYKNMFINKTVFICSYVPDIEARKLTAKCRYFYSYYPPDEEKKRLPKR